MVRNIPAFNPQVVPTMQRIYGLADEACRAAGDMDVIEFSCLVDVAEHTAGLEHKKAKDHYSFLGDALQPFLALEEKELIERKRSTCDRRSFAFTATLKGRDRLELIDKAIALLLVGVTARATEQRFEQFVGQLHAVAYSEDNQLVYSSLFPGLILRSLCAFHRMVVEESSVAGVSTTAFALLNILQDQPAGVDVATMAYRAGIPDAIIDAFLERTEERHWLRGSGNVFTLTETGKQKCAALNRSVDARRGAIAASMSARQWEEAEQIVENCLYLFG